MGFGFELFTVNEVGVVANLRNGQNIGYLCMKYERLAKRPLKLQKGNIRIPPEQIVGKIVRKYR